MCWGGDKSKSVNIGGAWNWEEQTMHINWLELRAAWLATEAFTQGKTSMNIFICLDNRSAVAYIKPQGAPVPTACLSWQFSFGNGLLNREIVLKARHLPGINWECAGRSNVEGHVHVHQDRTNWNSIFSRINNLWDPLQGDLFATWLSAQLDWFYSWKPEPSTEAINSLLQDWASVRGYANLSGACYQECWRK